MRKRNRKQLVLLIVKIFAVFVVLGVIAFFIFRNALLNKAIAKVAHKIERDYNSKFEVKQASFKGFSGITMQGITLVPKDADTLLHIQSLTTDVNVSRLLTGKIQLGRLEMKNGYIQLVRNKKGKNFDAFLRSAKKKKTEEPKEKEKVNYAKKAYRLLNRALNLVPTDMTLQNLSLRLNDMGREVSIDLTALRLADKQLESSFGVTEKDKVQSWQVKGVADPRNKQTDLKFFNNDTSRIELPYISERFNLKSGFDSIRVNVQNIDMEGDELHIDGFAAINDFMVNHPKIARKDVVINNARFDYHFLFGADFMELDSTSSVQFNNVKLTPFAKYSIEKDTVYQLQLHIPKMQAQDFITSLPKGLFSNFEGMEAEGSFSYDLDFVYNKNKPKELVFDSNLKKDGLKITKYGEANLAKLNTAFTYMAIDRGVRQRPIVVGPENPNFTPLDQISPYLQKAVLTSEDPSFFHHRGFITEAFRQSIIKNIQTKKFARGASTISMQLVKNVFLTREKTLSRKLEEILLVYILENNRIAGKERMLEVYFNVIEWGPDVYGIGEASQYYFQKMPAELTLDECLFLASIVPRPKSFMWQFNDEGKLKPYAERHNTYIRDLMLRRQLITPEDTLQQEEVYINGPARARLKIKDTMAIANDSIDIDDFLFTIPKVY
ncbi:glycosyl transferase [Flavobacterium salilacus subsp. salilacus]|uniref:transglycosylase domain-containing protein n=1 Tax=Flavobacterium TaxID=237 RepID=UPI00107518B1|nr:MULTISPECIES: biosynthetic peptidoglycan transglycosylase [Flavobacterium]KAF2518859.1 glycosyl transferase [Flavobacterium salilacus subsp. salilacus]MBE1614981.1 transglycosylase domain-containing protein [Flavobacterium sp. SaA2.13]